MREGLQINKIRQIKLKRNKMINKKEKKYLKNVKLMVTCQPDEPGLSRHSSSIPDWGAPTLNFNLNLISSLFGGRR